MNGLGYHTVLRDESLRTDRQAHCLGYVAMRSS